MNIPKLSVINDEISDNFDESLKFLVSNHIDYVELRYIGNKNILDCTIEEINNIKEKLDRNNIQVSAIASPLFKWCPESDNQDTRDLTHNDLMFGFNKYIPKHTKIDYIMKAFVVAKIFETKYVRIFSLIKSEGQENDSFWNEESDLYELALTQARDNHIDLLLENGLSTYFYSTSQILNFKNLYGDNYKLLLDIGNTYVIGQPIGINDFEKTVDSIEYIHLKDFDEKNKAVVELGKGDIPYKSLFRILLKNGYDGFFSIEPEGKENKIDLVQNSINYLRQLEVA
ncbi:MAG: TIM barrel protein [Microgenomates group bacterium]